MELSKLPSSHDAQLLVCRPRKLKIRKKESMYQKGFIRLLAISDFFTTLCKDFFIVTISDEPEPSWLEP